MYISKTECSVGEYQTFLNEINGQNDLLTKVYQEEWMNLKPFKSYYEAFHDTYGYIKNMPVVNISQAGAEAYCRWLTKKYNDSNEKEFKKVVFRLPSKKEWLLAYNKYSDKIELFDKLFFLEKAKSDSNMEANGWSADDLMSDLGNSQNVIQMMEYINSDECEKHFLVCRTEFPELKSTPIKHMNTNVSEWLKEENTAIGNNWRTIDYAFKGAPTLPLSSETFKAEFPAPTIGFRVLWKSLKNRH